MFKCRLKCFFFFALYGVLKVGISGKTEEAVEVIWSSYSLSAAGFNVVNSLTGSSLGFCGRDEDLFPCK